MFNNAVQQTAFTISGSQASTISSINTTIISGSGNVNFKVDSKARVTGSICMQSGNLCINNLNEWSASAAILVGTGSRQWRDLIGDVVPKTTGAGSPTLDTIRGQVRWFRYSAGDDGDIVFHIPHDYAPGTDMYFHPHWTHNGTNITGNFQVTYNFSYAKRTLSSATASAFIADRVLTQNITGITIDNTPQYGHRVDEVQMSTVGGSASTLDTNTIETDGLILLHFDVDTIPTITGGGGEPFILTIDIHYQSTGIGTPNKDPNFYVG